MGHFALYVMDVQGFGSLSCARINRTRHSAGLGKYHTSPASELTVVRSIERLQTLMQGRISSRGFLG